MSSQEKKASSEKTVNVALSQFKFTVLIVFFMIMAIVPILAISEINKTKSPLAMIILMIWVFVFFKLANSLHDKKVASYWVTFPSAFLVVIASFFY